MTKRRLWLPATLILTGVAYGQTTDLQVELMNQIGTDVSRKGDLISGRVLSPAALQGDLVEGKVTESKPGAKLGGQSAFAFSFDTLKHGGSTIQIHSQFKSVVNSKGRANVDEEGRIVRRATGNVARAAGGTGAGALIGGLAGGHKGAAIGAAVGAGASILLIQVAADGPNIRFAAGTKLTIEASARDGSSLAALRATPPPETPSAPAALPPPPPPPPTANAASAPPPAASSPQPTMTVLKATFVPGEKTIFFDDFTDMTPDDAPPHFKVRGAAPELRGAGALRQLSAVQRGSIFPNLTALPKNFTFETEVKVDSPKRAISTMILYAKDKEVFTWSVSALPTDMDQVVSLRSPYSELGRKRIPVNWNEPVKIALWVQNGRIRTFVNGEKHLDFNQVDLPEINKVEFAHDFYGAGQALGYRMMRFAESAPDFSQVIASSGRYVTHGILFDTDSDRLKPESAPVLQAIARGLETNPNLRLLIEGHTDSVGNAAHNLELSKRRADAVKAVLATQFKIDETRLTTAGLGAAKPIDSNDTPQGRSQNRRVELVKQ